MPRIIALSDFARKQGLRLNDEIIGMGGYAMQDTLDYLYFDNESHFNIELKRDGKQQNVYIRKKDYQSLGLEFDCEMKPCVCKNKCIFCFVDQLPKGMRDTLYIKDDDYRFSFISGSYITMTNVSDGDIARILRLKLSPLYISVHAFDDHVRLYMLKNPNTLKLKQQMRKLGEGGIKMHTQLVVVPNVNDGKVLEESIRGLHAMRGVETVAVVPVGMTGHRDSLEKITPVDEQNARDTITLVERLHIELGGFCWCSDEYYVKAGLPVPNYEYYGAFDQIENGVGLVADFYDNYDYSIEQEQTCNLNKKVVMLTGTSFAPLLAKRIGQLEELLGIECKVIGIVNNFFGNTVTVAGLVTAGDIIAQVDSTEADAYVIPDNMLREFTDTFLDNVTLSEVEKALKAPIITVAHNGSDIAQRIKAHFEE